ncbi:MAG: rhomboid family intramembrane serine protease [Bacteroidetes bacterium]|nr:rhomboid family intramembrane serine protease [Bacteroidota bacterium]MBS1974521.1 rhomboid family intramembrane serine protease [Bacteroidota bacterium]
MTVTLIIIIATSIISFSGFSNNNVIDKLIFYPPAITNQKEWYRFFTCGFIHKDIAHLVFNMYALFLFGQGQESHLLPGVEVIFSSVFGAKGKMFYLLMYLLALPVCLLPTFEKNRNNYYYRSLGASGAVSAVVFAYIMLNPMQGVGLIFIPVFIPGFLFGAIYLFVSYLLDKRGGGGINHSAHIWGALFGIAFVIVTSQLFSDYHVFANFIESVKNFELKHLFTTY